MVGQGEKEIYNIYLRVLAEAQDRPFRYRKNFDNLEDEKANDLIRLNLFFERFPHINKKRFIEAPYKLWGDDEYYPLKFYNKRKALKAYVTYKKKLINLPPDDPHHLKWVIDSFKFIKRFCFEKNINPNNYLDYKDGNYAFLKHLKEESVDIYALFAYEGFKNKLKNNVDSELKRILLGDTFTHYDVMYRKYLFSKKCKIIAKKCLQKIEK